MKNGPNVSENDYPKSTTFGKLCFFRFASQIGGDLPSILDPKLVNFPPHGLSQGSYDAILRLQSNFKCVWQVLAAISEIWSAFLDAFLHEYQFFCGGFWQGWSTTALVANVCESNAMLKTFSVCWSKTLGDLL